MWHFNGEYSTFYTGPNNKVILLSSVYNVDRLNNVSDIARNI